MPKPKPKSPIKTPPQKIIIFGFPHSGTSILKSIMGHIPDIREIVQETLWIPEVVTQKKYVLCKYPYTEPIFFTGKYKDYIKIFIVRNPLYVYSSLNKRYVNKKDVAADCRLPVYNNTLIHYCNSLKSPIPNLYLIRYEDIFEDNFRSLRSIFDAIGLKYTDQIFNNEQYKNRIIPGVKLAKERPANHQHESFRTWQINQPFVNNNDPASVTLKPEQVKFLLSQPAITSVYPNLREEWEAILALKKEDETDTKTENVV